MGVIILNINKLLKKIKINETKISSIFGITVIIIAGYYFFSYFRSNSTSDQVNIEIGNENFNDNTYVVEQGDDLWKISEKYFSSGDYWAEIAKANNIENPYVITEGQTITIPDISENLSSENNTDQVSGVESAQVNKNEYVVEQGDTLWSIAEKITGSGFNWIKIANDNKINGPYTIEVGQKLIISSETTNEMDTVDTYVVKKGDSLWKIAENIYGDGFKWTVIANANKISNPSLIFEGNNLVIP